MKDYLPVGTVVQLKNGEKKLLIIGYKVKSENSKAVKNGVEIETSETYDYCGVFYPEGIISSDFMLMFNHDDIASIFHKGYISEEYENIKTFLNKE